MKMRNANPALSYHLPPDPLHRQVDQANHSRALSEYARRRHLFMIFLGKKPQIYTYINKKQTKLHDFFFMTLKFPNYANHEYPNFFLVT